MLKLSPVDVFIFGDGKPFNASEQNFREFKFFINPVPIVSAFNKLTKEDHNISFVAFVKNDKLLFKTPVDIKKLDNRIITPKLRRIIKDEYVSSLGSLEYILDYHTDEKLASPEAFMAEDGFKKYLLGELDENQKDEYFLSVFSLEDRVGISIDRSSRATKEGYLYLESFLRFYEDIGIVVDLEKSLDLKYITLGGESKISKVDSINVDPEKKFEDIKDKIKNKVEKTGFFKIVLLTPSNDIPEIKGAKLHIQQSSDILVYSSWFNLYENDKKKSSYPSRIYRLIPEGSVFYYELEDKSRLDEIFNEFWLKPCFYTNEYPFFDKKNPVGFGLSIIGVADIEE